MFSIPFFLSYDHFERYLWMDHWYQPCPQIQIPAVLTMSSCLVMITDTLTGLVTAGWTTSESGKNTPTMVNSSRLTWIIFNTCFKIQLDLISKTSDVPSSFLTGDNILFLLFFLFSCRKASKYWYTLVAMGNQCTRLPAFLLFWIRYLFF